MRRRPSIDGRLGAAARSDYRERADRLVRRLADAGALDGLDVVYATTDTPFGPLVVAATGDGVVRLSFDAADVVLTELARTISPRILRAPARLDTPRRELDEYFAGRRRHFDVPLDWRLIEGFRRRVLDVTARIPYGSMSSYGVVAERAGNPRAARAAGTALAGNPIPILVPCHRVVRSTGNLGGYGGGLDMKRRLLVLEGALAA